MNEICDSDCGKARALATRSSRSTGMQVSRIEEVRDLRVDVVIEKLIDERVPVTVDEAYRMCVRLAAAGFFVGQSSGAYMAGVEHVARGIGRGRFVTLFNDIGERYFSTRLWD